MAELELAKVRRAGASSKPNVRPVNPALDRRPEALNQIGIDGPAHVFPAGAVHRFMLVAQLFQKDEGSGFVGLNPCAGADLL